MRLIKIRRKTKQENRHHPRMGALSTQVTYIQKTLLGLPFKTLHKYRETYKGEVKACEDCKLSLV